MGSIFKPSTTVVQAPQQSSTSYDIPQYFKDIQERTLKKAENLGQRPYQAYTGQMIAPLSACTTVVCGLKILPIDYICSSNNVKS